MPDQDERLALFETWYDEALPRLFNYVSYRVRDQAAAEDLTAAICERGYASLHQFNARRGDFNGWMFGIARNAVHDHHRARARHGSPVSLDALPDLDAPGQSVEEAFEDMEVFRQAVIHLRDLPEQEQEVIALRFGAEMSNQEISETLGITANHAGVLVHRALKKLRQTLRAGEEAQQ